jgi:hypothetical protein
MTTDTKSLEKEAAKLRTQLAKPSEKELAQAELARLETEIAARREADGKAEAEQRQVGISRAFGSLAAELEDDEQRVRETAQQYSKALVTMNLRYQKLMGLRAEANALSHRFGIPGPDLAPVVVPALRGLVFDLPAPVEHAHVRQHVEKDEFGRTRRDYREIEGTPGYSIIQEVGLVARPPLTERQQAAAAAKRRQVDADRRQAEEFRRAVEDVEAMPPVPGNIHRG